MIESSFEETLSKKRVETQITDWTNELVILRQVIPWQAIITQLTQFYSNNFVHPNDVMLIYKAFGKMKIFARHHGLPFW